MSEMYQVSTNEKFTFSFFSLVFFNFFFLPLDTSFFFRLVANFSLLSDCVESGSIAVALTASFIVFDVVCFYDDL